VASILVGITGGIAAYKAPGVIRRLRETGNEVRVVATEAAFRFIPEETLSIAAGGGVHTDVTWWEISGRVEHVFLARWADLVLVAPATAPRSWLPAPALCREGSTYSVSNTPLYSANPCENLVLGRPEEKPKGVPPSSTTNKHPAFPPPSLAVRRHISSDSS